MRMCKVNGSYSCLCKAFPLAIGWHPKRESCSGLVPGNAINWRSPHALLSLKEVTEWLSADRQAPAHSFPLKRVTALEWFLRVTLLVDKVLKRARGPWAPQLPCPRGCLEIIMGVHVFMRGLMCFPLTRTGVWAQHCAVRVRGCERRGPAALEPLVTASLPQPLQLL